jgi:DNA primase
MGRSGLATSVEAVLGPSRPCGPRNVAFPCPFHKEGKERHPSFTVNIYSGASQCHACGVRFPTIEKLLEALGRTSDIQFLKQLGVLDYIVDRRRAPKKLEEIPEDVLYDMLPVYDKLPQFEPRTLDHFEVRYDDKVHTIVYPLRDRDGKLVRIHARWLDEDAYTRYRFYKETEYALHGVKIPDKQTMGKGPNFIHGRVYNKVLADAVDTLVLVEGPKQAMRVWESGFQQVMAFMGSPSEGQMFMLQCLRTNIFLMLDNNYPGWSTTERVLKNFKKKGIRNVRTVDYRGLEKEQPDELSHAEVQWLMEEEGVESWVEG